MSGSTRAPDPASPLVEARSLEDGPAELSGGPGRGDAYVDRLGDRLTASHPPPPVDPRRATIPPAAMSRGPLARPAIESSDVRPMPPEDRDDAIDFPPSDPLHPPDAFAEFEEDELVAEHTEIDGREGLLSETTQIFDESPPMPVLYVEAGRDEGREYVLVEGETTVGRGIDNEVILADVSVSRRHLKIVREGDVLLLRDLGSGNGTLLNGHRVSSATLAEGDRIELGETILVVRLPGADLAAAARDPEPVRAGEHTTDESMPPGPIAGFPGPSGPMQESAWSLPPTAGPTLPPPAPTPSGWLPSSERTGTVVLDRRTLLLSAGGIAIGASVIGALVVAVLLRSSSSQPVASTLPIESPPVIAPPMLVPAASQAPRVVQPTAVPQPTTVPQPTAVPAPIDPPPAPSTPAAVAVAPPAQPPPAEEPEAQAAAEPEGARARPQRGRAPRPVRIARTTSGPTAPARGADAVLAAYRSGDFAAASRQARAAGQGSLATQIDQFATHYRATQTAARGSAQSISAMERAIAIDGQIVRGGHYSARLRTQLAGAYLDSAQAAMRARPQDACRSVQLAQRQGDGGARAGALARQCEIQAQALVSQAAGLERSDVARARALYRSVLPMVPSSSPSYTRARQRIDALARAQSVDEDE